MSTCPSSLSPLNRNQGYRLCNRDDLKVQVTRQSKRCGFSIYIFDNSKSKSMVRSEKMALSGLVFARKIARMILIQNIQGLMGPLMINMAFMPLYMWEMWDVTPVTHGHTDSRKVEQYSVWTESAKWDVKVKWNGLRLKNGKPGKAFRLKTNSKEWTINWTST